MTGGDTLQINLFPQNAYRNGCVLGERPVLVELRKSPAFLESVGSTAASGAETKMAQNHLEKRTGIARREGPTYIINSLRLCFLHRLLWLALDSDYLRPVAYTKRYTAQDLYAAGIAM